LGHALAISLTGLVNTLNMPLYVLGGGVCDAWDLFAPTMFREMHVRSYVYRLTEPPVLEPERLEAGKTYVLKAQLGPAAGLLGACLLGFKEPSGISPSGEELLVHQ
jgi:glucokinase